MKAQTKQAKRSVPDDSKLVHTWFDLERLARLDDFRFKNQFPTRKDALMWLLDYALDQKPKVER
jgi:hypothetical protein